MNVFLSAYCSVYVLDFDVEELDEYQVQSRPDHDKDSIITDILVWKLEILSSSCIRRLIYRLERYEKIHKARNLAYTRFYISKYVQSDKDFKF